MCGWVGGGGWVGGWVGAVEGEQQVRWTALRKKGRSSSQWPLSLPLASQCFSSQLAADAGGWMGAWRGLPSPPRGQLLSSGFFSPPLLSFWLFLAQDPVFSNRCSPFQFMGPQRNVPPALDAASPRLPAVDFVLISHNHYDHLDTGSVRSLNERFGDSLTW